ncbi:MAG: signal peptidase II [Bacteroidota bacterium]|nr:signal peptidase II [Bacteroidota bacterium]
MNAVKTILILVIVTMCIGCDQATKHLAKNELAFSSPVTLFKGAVSIVYAENSGGMLSLGESLSDGMRFWLLTVFTGFALAGLVMFLFFSSRLDTMQTIALSLVAGGGFGNLIDRMMNGGRVIDFITIRIAGMHSGVFNFADIAITTGVFLMLIATRRQRERAKDKRHPSVAA